MNLGEFAMKNAKIEIIYWMFIISSIAIIILKASEVL